MKRASLEVGVVDMGHVFGVQKRRNSSFKEAKKPSNTYANSCLSFISG